METQKRCAACATDIHLEARKCPHCRSRQPGPSTLHRAQDGKMIAGVCAGLARELGADVAWVRVAFALTALMSFGLVFWAYVILWMITPAEAFGQAPLANLSDKVRRFFSATPRPQGTPRAEHL